MKGVAMQQTNSLNVAAEKVIHDFLKRFTDNKHFATDKEKEEFIEETIKVVNIVVDDTKSSNNIRVNELKQEIVDELRNELATKADIADLKATMAEMKATMAEMKVNFATKAEIAESKTDIIKWLSAFQITVVGVAVAIIKLF